MNTRKEILG